MNRLFYKQGAVPNTDQLIEEVKRTSAQEIIIMCEREWECGEINPIFSDSLKEFNVKLRPVYGSFRTEYYDVRHGNSNLSVEDAYFWGTFWINYVEFFTKKESGRYKFQSDFKHKFISLNNRSHLHRCMFIDEMAKHNLIDKGVVTWIKHLNENSNFPYKYYNNQQRLLDDDFVNKLDSMSLPKEYDESFFDIITESTPDKMFMTEKTFLPIVLRKPFIVLGAKDFHKKLVDLGFKLYDEIIDYSFDSIDNLEERTTAFVQNVKRIVECNVMEVYEILKPKLLHNYIKMLELSADNNLVPAGVRQYCDANSANEGEKNYVNMLQSFVTKKQKKDKVVSIWSRGMSQMALDIQEIKDECENINQVIIHMATESPYYFYRHVVEVCHKLMIPTVFLTSTYTYNKTFLPWDSETYNNTIVIDWAAYWIARGTIAMCESKHHSVNVSRGLDIYNSEAGLGYDIKYLYTTMNNLAKSHRCLVMDLLAKYDLIDNGAIAWRDVFREFDNNRTEIVCENTYDWKYWTPKKMILDFPMDLTSNVEQACIPPQYKHSFMQIVTESNPNFFFVTEKTAVPLIFNKLFLVAASKDFHKNLKDMGFELYDEIFDYSFDSIENIDLRYEGIIENVNKYRNKTNEELTQILESMKEKLLRNRKHSIKLAREIPNAFYDTINRVEEQNPDPSICYINKVRTISLFNTEG